MYVLHYFILKLITAHINFLKHELNYKLKLHTIINMFVHLFLFHRLLLLDGDI